MGYYKLVVHSIGIPSRVTLGARGRGTAVERAGEVPQRSKDMILLHACLRAKRHCPDFSGIAVLTLGMCMYMYVCMYDAKCTLI